MTWHGYAALKMNEFLDMVGDGTRDLASAELSPFYDNAPAVSREEVSERMGASSAYRGLNNLPSIGEDVFSFQVSKG